MQVQNHTIKRFSFELQTQGVQQSHALQKKCIKVVNENLLLAMDKALSSHFSFGEIVRIKKIEIDLGDITAENLEEELAAKCLESLINTIKAIPVKQKVSEADEVKIIGEDENYIQQFFYFLVEGKMLWMVKDVDFQLWQSAIIKATVSSTSFFKTAFIKLLQENKNALERLLLQFDDAFLVALVALFEKDIEKNTADYITGTIQINAGRINDIIAGKTIQAKDAITVLLKNMMPAELTPVKISFEESIAAKKDTAKNTGIEKIEQEEDNSIFIDNAGIIILHPFLQNFFNATGLTDNNNFKKDDSKQRAVHLLQYLVNGGQETPEYILPLNKILCGIPGEEHIERFVILEENEKQEAAALLQSVLEHWKNLKNTSAEALQETFFQRKGKLIFNATNGYWKLQGERKAVDILLDRIPWGISYIQLPWMQYALVTEW